MGARLGTVPGWERISSSTDEPREYIGVGPTKIIYPDHTGNEIAEYWVRFDINLNYCDSPPISPIVIRNLTNILIIQKFIETPPDFQEWIDEITDSEALDVYRMSIIEMGGLRDCGEGEDNYSITITGQGKIEQPKPKPLEIEKLKEIQRGIDTRKIKEKEKIKQEKIEEESKIEIIKKQVKIYKQMKKEPDPLIKKVSDQMIEYYEEKEKELLKNQEKKKKNEIRKIKQAEKELKAKKKEEIKEIEKGIPIPEPIKKELTTMDVIQISRLTKSITKFEKQKKEQQKYLDITLGAIERIEESGKLEFLLGQVVTRDRWMNEINITNIKIERQKEAIEKIRIGG